MPYVLNRGLRIHYQVDGDGPPLLLQHGATSTLQTWYDLRRHGRRGAGTVQGRRTWGPGHGGARWWWDPG